MKEKIKNTKGITLVALIITIIVLLILAVVAITSIRNSNIIKYAQNGRDMYNHGKEDEGIKLNEYEKYIEDELPGGKTGDIETISKTESYVGYYADIDADGTVDGVIYADLAKGDNIEKEWNNNSNSKYTIPTVTEGLKDYYISQTNYKANDGFGTKDVISPTGTGTERFYIMALKDITKNGTYYDWYNAAYNQMSDYADTTSEDFGKGKSNTTTMITKWNATEYGDKDKCSSHKDMWGQIQEEVNNGWFVPSRAEWLAFGGELGITPSNYGNFGLSNYYWSSSQRNTNRAWYATFNNGYMTNYSVNHYNYVRLSATF